MPDRPIFEKRLEISWPAGSWADIPVLLAVSGGADSVALLCAAAANRRAASLFDKPVSDTSPLWVAHLNHRLRDTESDDDEQFVRDLCRRLDLPCVVERFGGDWERFGVSEGLEAAAREARYDFLLRTAKEHGVRLIATAHTADDQAETILHRIIRGTGIAGLSGIHRTRELSPGIAAIRPMLEFSRGDVIEYLTEIGQSYRVDSSNASLKFTRNRIRRELLPLIEKDYSATVRQSLIRLGQQAAWAQVIVDERVDEIWDRMVSVPTSQRKPVAVVDIDCYALIVQPDYLIHELFRAIWNRFDWPLRDMGTREWERLSAAVRESDVSFDLPGPVRVRRYENMMQLRRLQVQ